MNSDYDPFAGLDFTLEEAIIANSKQPYRLEPGHLFVFRCEVCGTKTYLENLDFVRAHKKLPPRWLCRDATVVARGGTIVNARELKKGDTRVAGKSLADIPLKSVKPFGSRP